MQLVVRDGEISPATDRVERVAVATAAAVGWLDPPAATWNIVSEARRRRSSRTPGRVYRGGGWDARPRVTARRARCRHWLGVAADESP
jgi:hypothetical protein